MTFAGVRLGGCVRPAAERSCQSAALHSVHGAVCGASREEAAHIPGLLEDVIHDEDVHHRCQ